MMTIDARPSPTPIRSSPPARCPPASAQAFAYLGDLEARCKELSATRTPGREGRLLDDIAEQLHAVRSLLSQSSPASSRWTGAALDGAYVELHAIECRLLALTAPEELAGVAVESSGPGTEIPRCIRSPPHKGRRDRKKRQDNARPQRPRGADYCPAGRPRSLAYCK